MHAPPLVNTDHVDYIARMPHPEKYPHKRLLQMDTELKDAIRRYRFDHELMSDAEAMRQLMWAGLKSASVRGEPERGARRS